MVFSSWMPYFSMLRWASANFTKASLAAAWGSRTPMTENTSPNAAKGQNQKLLRYSYEQRSAKVRKQKVLNTTPPASRHCMKTWHLSSFYGHVSTKSSTKFQPLLGKTKQKNNSKLPLGVRVDYSTCVILFLSFVTLDLVTDLCGFEKAQKTPSVVFLCAPSALQRKQRTTASLWIKSSLISVIMAFSHYMINLFR